MTAGNPAAILGVSFHRPNKPFKTTYTTKSPPPLRSHVPQRVNSPFWQPE